MRTISESRVCVCLCVCVCVCVCVCRKPDCLHILDIAVFSIATNSFATNHYSLRNKLSLSSRHCIHSRCCLRFLARSCVLRLYWSLSCVTWCTFHSDTRPQIIQYFWFHKENIISGFAICHPGQRWVPLLVVHKLQYFLQVFNPLPS
jgi:hypothetical protein